MTRDFYALLAVAMLATGHAHAQERSRPGAGSVLPHVVPDQAAAIRIRAEARERLLDALYGDPQERLRDALSSDRPLGSDPLPDVLLEEAIARYTRVLEVFPGDVDAWLELGHALDAFERTTADGRHETRSDEALAAYEHARALDPEREAGFVAFALAVLHTRRGEYAEAEAEYARAYDARARPPHVDTLVVATWSARESVLAQMFLPPPPQTTLANWAEITMLAGDPTTAAERYRAAIAASPAGTDAAALGLWGLALAQERAASHADALETALRAIDASRGHDGDLVDRYGAFVVLHLSGVFFEPACEIHAYESLGHEALAMRASTAEGRAAEWTSARLSARFFLAEGGRSSIYASTATDADARLTQLLAR